MTPSPSPPNADDCIYCSLGSPAAKVAELRRLINQRAPHTICAPCRREMAMEVTDQLARMAQAPSRKWD